MIIGSTALEQFGLNRRTPKDFDTFYFAEDDGGDSYKIPEELYNLIPSTGGCATPEAILTLKMSHLQWDIHWWKTLQDILWLKCKHTVKYNEELYFELSKHWKTVHGNKQFLNLSQNKKDFFTDHVSYPQDHDELHLKVSYPNEPIYKRCLSATISIDKGKFEALPFKEKVNMFKEEITVIALERFLLNEYNDIDTVVQAYQQSLKKTITNLTKNWASDFIIMNIEEFISIPFEMFYNVLNLEEKEMSENLEKFKELIASTVNEQELYEKDEYLVALCVSDENHTDIEVIKQEGGGEGGTEYCYAILKHDDNFFKVSYSYYSHQGYSESGAFNSITEVKAKEKMITVYE